MTIPNAQLIETLVKFRDVPAAKSSVIANALGAVVASILLQHSSSTVVSAGIRASALPPDNTGITIAPGALQSSQTIHDMISKSKVAEKTSATGLNEPQKSTLDAMLERGLKVGLEAISTATMQPGVPIENGASTAQAKLYAPQLTSLTASLSDSLKQCITTPGEMAARSTPANNEIPAVALPLTFCEDLCAFLTASFTLYLSVVRVAAGIPCEAGITTAPGELI